MTENESRQLLARVAKGDQNAFARLYRTYASIVKAFVMHTLPPSFRIASDDIVSETFISLWRSCTKFEGRSQFRTWLLGIARFKTLEWLRSERNKLPLADSDESVDEIDDGADADTVRWLASKEIGQALDQCLAKLGVEQRTTIYLVHLEGMGPSEVAAFMNVPLDTVKSRLRLAMPRLRVCLKQTLELSR